MKKRYLLVIVGLVFVASLLSIMPAVADDDCAPPSCPPPPTCANPPGTGTPGFWKNHPEAWQRCNGQLIAELPLGCKCEPCYCYDCCLVPKATLINWMENPVKGNKVYTMVSALIAAKLNRLAGNQSDCINPVIMQATQWMQQYGFVDGECGLLGHCKASDPCWQNYEWLYELLDKYNNGELCAPERD
jgi:hypothetical protein